MLILLLKSLFRLTFCQASFGDKLAFHSFFALWSLIGKSLLRCSIKLLSFSEQVCSNMLPDSFSGLSVTLCGALTPATRLIHPSLLLVGWGGKLKQE